MTRSVLRVDFRKRALLAGGEAGLVLFAVGAFQAVVVALDAYHGMFGQVVFMLFFPAMILAMVPPVLLGRSLGRAGRSAGVAVVACGALVGVVASVGYFITSIALHFLMFSHIYSSNPSMIPAFDWSTYALFLVIACLLGALCTVVGAARMRSTSPAVARES